MTKEIAESTVKQVSIRQLGFACGDILRSTSIRNHGKMQQTKWKFLNNCGIETLTSIEVNEFDAGFKEGYSKE